jgi:hypothetical protein
MLGQLCEPLAPERAGGAWLPGAGAVGVVRAGAVLVVVEPAVVEPVDVAALAIAAPPPAIADVAAIATSSGLSLRMSSPPFVWTAADIARPASDRGRRRVRVC